MLGVSNSFMATAPESAMMRAIVAQVSVTCRFVRPRRSR